MRIAVRMRYEPYAQQLLGEVLGDESGRPYAVHIGAAGPGERGDGRAELAGVESGGGIGEGLLLLVRQFGDDVGDRVVDGDVGGDGGRPPGLLLGGQTREGEPQIR